MALVQDVPTARSRRTMRRGAKHHGDSNKLTPHDKSTNISNTRATTTSSDTSISVETEDMHNTVKGNLKHTMQKDAML